MDAAPLRLAKNPDGGVNIEWQGRALHSRRNPKQEALRFLNQVEPERGPLLVAGLGWGYLLEAAAELSPLARKNLYFFEPLAEVLAFWRASDRLQTLQELQLALFFDTASLRSALPPGKVRIEVHPAYGRMLPALALELQSALQGDVDESAKRRFIQQWLWHALRRLCQPGAIEFLQASAPLQRPSPLTLYCGAAPTLFDDLAPLQALLRQERRRFYVVAVDTAVAPLLAAGLRPDLALSIDSGAATNYHLGAALQRSLALPRTLSWLAGSPSLESCTESLIFYRSSLPVDQWLAAGPLKSVEEFRNETRNALGLALLAARATGSAALALAGASFEERSGLSHTPGSGYSEFARWRASRLQPVAGYRPQAYRRSNSRRAQLAIQGMQSMAQSAGLEIWTGAAVAERIGRLAAAPTALPVQSYPRKEFADFLLRHWPDFSASLQREHAIAPAALSRWRQMLRRAHDFETKDEKIFSRRGR